MEPYERSHHVDHLVEWRIRGELMPYDVLTPEKCFFGREIDRHGETFFSKQKLNADHINFGVCIFETPPQLRLYGNACIVPVTG